MLEAFGKAKENPLLKNRKSSILNTLYKILLLPITLFYWIGIVFRNLAYDLKLLKSKKHPIPIIGVGNLSVGGTGKTPTVEFLVRSMQMNQFRPAVISRGYKRKTKGCFEVNKKHTAADIGDEPFQLMQKFPNLVIYVAENRNEAVEQILQKKPQIDVVILDDAFQHRSIKPGLQILLTQYSKLYSKDVLLPSGRLREPISGRKRADIIAVTKSLPVKSPFEEKRLLTELKVEPNQSFYMSYIEYDSPIPLNSKLPTLSTEQLKKKNILLFTAIANPIPIVNYLKQAGKETKKLFYPDHHYYTPADVDKIKKAFNDIFQSDKVLITTEKDARRIQGTEIYERFKDLPVYYIPIRMAFHSGLKGEDFLDKVIDYVKENPRKR